MAIVQEKLLRFQESLDYLILAEEVDPASPKTKILKERITQILVGIENGTISASDYLSGYKKAKQQELEKLELPPHEGATLAVNEP